MTVQGDQHLDQPLPLLRFQRLRLRDWTGIFCRDQPMQPQGACDAQGKITVQRYDNGQRLIGVRFRQPNLMIARQPKMDAIGAFAFCILQQRRIERSRLFEARGRLREDHRGRQKFGAP